DLEFTPLINKSLFYIVILSVIGTAIAKVFFNKLVQISSPVFSTSVTYLIPIVAVFWGFLDGERLSVMQLFSGLIILIGVYLAKKSD
ncbi:MAG TPA: permease, partial [Flavobacteriaceae bacterium]|nr:permease [Flavobacteriaceae bacterium]